jgi:hypothetical protein
MMGLAVEPGFPGESMMGSQADSARGPNKAGSGPMPQVVGTTFEMLLDLDLDTIVGALVLAVLVATLTAGAYLWLRRGKSDVTAMLVSLIVIANLACLVTGAGFIRSKSQSPHPLALPGSRQGTIAASPRHPGRDATMWRRTYSSRHGHADGFLSGEHTPGPPDL